MVTTHLTKLVARTPTRTFRFDGFPRLGAHILLRAGCVSPSYGPIGMTRQLPQVPSGNRRPQRTQVGADPRKAKLGVKGSRHPQASREPRLKAL